MNSLIVFAFLVVVPAALSSAVGTIVAGPPGTGVVTNAGAISPAGLGLGLVGPALGWNAGLVAPAIVASPALGWGGVGTIGLGHGGVAVQGPLTVPATIVGPSGKIVAEGLYGVPSYGHGW